MRWKPIVAVSSITILGAVPALAYQNAEEAVARANAERNAAQAENLDPEAMRCERIRQTASRVRSQRICMTNRQWEMTRRSGNRDARDVIEVNNACPTPDAGC